MDKHSLSYTLIVSHLVILLVLGTLLFANLPDWTILIGMIIVVAFMLATIQNKLRKHYREISKTAERIAQGDHSQRIPSLELDEFDHLAQNLNSMLGKLDNTIHHLAIHREELRLVLSSIDDVLWSQNPEGRLVWANEAFMNLFNAYNPDIQQYYWDVIREPVLLQKIKEGEATQDRLMTEIQIGEAGFLLSCSKNDAARRRVFILQDIAAIRAAEKMKKDFVVNLAHELRTPLTAIKGFTEAMQDNPNADSERYLKIIGNHTDRLIHLISDLEQLIRLERTSEISMQEISLNTFFDNLQMILAPHIEAKGLKFNLILEENLPRFACDPFKLEQVFINLVQNSLRYTDSGSINIHCQAVNNDVTFKVSDTGIGIDPSHLPRIFERFYVADPSRNRLNSGTGLGLAIVKHIVILHNGKIEVSSEPGMGTSFSIRLPNTASKYSHDRKASF